MHLNAYLTAGDDVITRDSAYADIQLYKNLRKQLKEHLRKLPKGRLYYKTINGRRRPFVMEDGKEKYLNRKNLNRIAGLQRRKEAEAAIAMINSNIALLDPIEKGFVDLDRLTPGFVSINDTYDSVKHRSRSEIAEIVDRWAEVKAGKPFYEGGLVASDNTRLKSRVELILYETFLNHSLNPVYEHPVMIDGELWYPDFSFVRQSDGEVILWEHFGMMDQPRYWNDAIYKIGRYADEGYLPFSNIVYSYDFGNDNIEIPYIYRLLKMIGVM